MHQIVLEQALLFTYPTPTPPFLTPIQSGCSHASWEASASAPPGAGGWAWKDKPNLV